MPCIAEGHNQPSLDGCWPTLTEKQRDRIVTVALEMWQPGETVFNRPTLRFLTGIYRPRTQQERVIPIRTAYGIRVRQMQREELVTAWMSAFGWKPASIQRWVNSRGVSMDSPCPPVLPEFRFSSNKIVPNPA